MAASRTTKATAQEAAQLLGPLVPLPVLPVLAMDMAATAMTRVLPWVLLALTVVLPATVLLHLPLGPHLVLALSSRAMALPEALRHRHRRLALRLHRLLRVMCRLLLHRAMSRLHRRPRPKLLRVAVAATVVV